MAQSGLHAVEAFSEVCGARPSLVQESPTRKGVGLYGWNTGPVREVHIPETRELILTVHLGGSRRVRVVTEAGLSRSYSKPGNFTLIPRGQPVSFLTEGAVDFATVHFPLEAPSARDADLWSRMLKLPSCLFAVADEYVVASVKTLMRATRSPARDNAGYISKLFDSLTGHLAQLIEESDAERIRLPTRVLRGIKAPDFERVIEYIESQLSEPLSLDELADHAGVSRALFAREFTSRFGCSPHRFVIRRRIERAKSLLAQGHRNLADIAYEVGFSGHSHFSTTFRAYEGCTPKTYVRITRQDSGRDGQ